MNSLNHSQARHAWPFLLWTSQLVILLPIWVYIVLRLVRGPALGGVPSMIAVAVLAYSLFCVSFILTRRGRDWIYSRRLHLATSAIAFLLAYTLLEVCASVLCVAGVIKRDHTLLVFENTYPTLQFDAIRGYTLTETPSRFARITNGIPEYVGVHQGNSQGFPDRDDWGPQRSAAGKKRIAVFGDSFTSAQFLSCNWPDRVEDLSRESGPPIELLNFGISGGGLANWWSVLTRLVGPEAYELDGVLFAVFNGDLRRGFKISETRGHDRYMTKQLFVWDPDRWPTTREEAEAQMDPQQVSYIVPPQEFELAIRGKWLPADYTEHRHQLPFIARRVESMIPKLHSRQNKHWEFGGRQALVADIASFLERKGLPALVVYIPKKWELLEKQQLFARDLNEFSTAIGATLVDGTEAFEGLSNSEIRAHWMPYDGHWAQSGSDRFARFMAEVLINWPETNNDEH